MRVIGVDRDKPELETLLDRRFPREELVEAVAEADHFFVTTSGGPETTHLVDAAVLKGMKPSAFLYNVSRGSVIEEDALVDALRSGAIAGAGLDVTEIEPLPESSPLWEMGNVILSAHSGGHSEPGYERLLTLIIDNLDNFHAGRPLENRIDL